MAPGKEVSILDIESVRRKHDARLFELPNVVGSAVGESHGKEVIVVYVSRKVVPESVLRPQDVIPKELEGYKTDVREIGEVEAH